MSTLRRTRAIVWAAAILAPLIGVLVFAFQDNLFRSAMDPRTPFQTTPAPLAPDYRDPSSWATRPQEPSPTRAAVFLVHPTTFWGRSGWNAALSQERPTERLTSGVLAASAGPFQGLGDVWAPHYRQASLYSALTHRYDARRARALAYEDVARAFEVFVAEAHPDAAIVIAGYEQGGLHVLGLLQHALRNDALARRLAAAYVIDQATPIDLFEGSGPLTHLELCAQADEARCVVAWGAQRSANEDEIERFRQRSMVWNRAGRLEATVGRAVACWNPLLNAPSEDFAPARLHQGAVNASGLDLGVTPAPVAYQTSAQCQDGVLLVEAPTRRSLRPAWSWGRRFKPNAINLFYADLSRDFRARLNAHTALVTDESQRAPPLDGVITLGTSPIFKVPED